MCRFSSEGLIKHLQSSGRPTEPRQPPALGCQVLSRWNEESPTSWPEQAEMPGSGFCLQVAFLLVLVLTMGPWRAEWQELSWTRPREKCESRDTTLQKEGPRSERHVPAWQLLDKARTSLNPLPMPILPKSSEF